jgi:hypothetical protein
MRWSTADEHVDLRRSIDSSHSLVLTMAHRSLDYFYSSTLWASFALVYQHNTPVTFSFASQLCADVALFRIYHGRTYARGFQFYSHPGNQPNRAAASDNVGRAQ